MVVVMVRRKMYKQFPAFFLYTAFEIVQVIVLFTMDLLPWVSGKAWTQGFVCQLAISAGLRFLVIYEVFAHLFRHYAVLRRFGGPLFRGALAGLFVAAVGLAAYAQGGDRSQWMFVLHVAQQTISIMQCGLIVCLFIFSAYLGLSWRNHVFGIAFGMGVFATSELAVSAILYHSGYHRFLDFVTMGTYQACVLIWMFYILGPAKSMSPASKEVPAHDLEIWNQELQRLLQQ